MILIAGATETVGSEVVKRLSAQGEQARALTRDLRKKEAAQFPRHPAVAYRSYFFIIAGCKHLFDS
jgi:uncharacterized protein YbjT (DUF2867 family)